MYAISQAAYSQVQQEGAQSANSESASSEQQSTSNNSDDDVIRIEVLKHAIRYFIIRRWRESIVIFEFMRSGMINLLHNLGMNTVSDIVFDDKLEITYIKDNIDMKYADEHGIVVTNTPDPVTEPTAELAFGLMHSLCRRIVELDRDIRIKDKIKWGLMQNIGSTMTNKTLGIIGFGRIGQALARRAVAAKMNIVYYSRHRVNEEIENLYHAKYVPMNELLKIADFVSLNTPLTAETTHLIGKEQLALMKPSAFLVNTSRGAVINEHELAEALRDNVIAGAGLDVYEKEPIVEPLLMTLNNAILVPHIGTATRETRQDTAIMACENILGFYAGKQDIHRCGKW